MANETPRTKAFDSTVRLLRDPYGFIPDQMRQHSSDLVETRLLLQRTIVMTGPEAAEVFYDENRVKRAGAAPLPVQLTLFGRNGVQTLDDDEHRHRKALFLSIAMDPDLVGRLADGVATAWRQEAATWTRRTGVALYPEMKRLLTREVCAWAGIPLQDSEVGRRTKQISSLFDEAAAADLRHVRSMLSRQAANRWAAQIVEDIRQRGTDASDETPAVRVALHRDPAGELLPVKVAAVELLNVIRPTVAVSVYLTLIAQALEDHPEWRARLRETHELDDAFVQEVRRHYPFFPATVARVRRDFEWRGHHFPAGRRVILGLHSTNHDERAWERPDEFRPERFVDQMPGAYSLIPQGGGDPEVHHRCPGEQITEALMRVGVDMLARRLDYEVVEPSGLDRSHAPALPKDGFRLRDVRLRE